MLQYSPKIVTDSLVMCLDPSQNKSYPATDLPVKNGLVMWMDAADDTTFSYSSGTTVSQWRDKSGFNYHMVPVSAGPTRNAFLNSRKVIACTTSQQIWNSAINLVTSPYTIFGVTRLTGTTNARVLTTQYVPSTGGNWLLGHWAGYVNQYYAEGWVSGPYGTSANTAWNIFMGDWSGSSTDLANLYTNGTAITTNSNGASAGPIGLGININSETSTCEAAEIVVFNRVLSTAERRLVDTYLGQKWGIANTDRSIIDLSGNNNNGLLGDGVTADMPLFDFYNKGSLKLDGSTEYIAVSNSTVLNPTTVTVSIWVKRNGYQSQTANYLRRNYNDAYAILSSPTDDSALRFRIHNGSTYPESPTTTLALNEWTNIVGTYDLTNIKIYKNGVFIGQTAHTSAISYASANTTLTIGRDDPIAGRYMNANYGSVLIYSRALTAAEIRQNYEAQKSKFANTIVQQGLVLNLDAGNPYSYAGAGTTWYDVSGNGKDFILDGSGITYNSGGYFSLADGGATRSATITNSTTCTVVVWIRTTDTQSLIFKGNIDNNYYLAAYYVGQGFYSNNCGSPTYWIDTTSVSNPNPTYLDGNWHMWEMKNVNLSSWTSYEFNKYSGFTFGNGAVGQIMIYDRNLSAAESLQIYNATKGRFGL